MSLKERILNQSQSPVIKPKLEDKQNMLFDFPSAMIRIKDGQKISRKEWDNEKIYGVLENEILILNKEGKKFSWTISLGDLTGDDWFIVE